LKLLFLGADSEKKRQLHSSKFLFGKYKKFLEPKTNNWLQFGPEIFTSDGFEPQ